MRARSLAGLPNLCGSLRPLRNFIPLSVAAQPRWNFGICDLGFIWDLEIGIWDFPVPTIVQRVIGESFMFVGHFAPEESFCHASQRCTQVVEAPASAITAQWPSPNSASSAKAYSVLPEKLADASRCLAACPRFLRVCSGRFACLTRLLRLSRLLM